MSFLCSLLRGRLCTALEKWTQVMETWKTSWLARVTCFSLCLFLFPKMTLSPITCEQQAAGPGQSLADGVCQGLRTGSVDHTHTYRYCLLTAHISVRTGGVIRSSREELDTVDAGWSYTVSKNLILKLRSDLSTAVQTPEVCPLRFFHKVRQEWKEPLMCKIFTWNWTDSFWLHLATMLLQQFPVCSLINYGARLWRRPSFLNADLGRVTF